MLKIRSGDEGSGGIEAGGGAGGPGVLEEHCQRDLSGRLLLELERAAPSLADFGGAQRLRPPRALDASLCPQCRFDGFRPSIVEGEAERTVQVKGLAHRVIAHATMLLVVAVACATPSVAQARARPTFPEAHTAIHYALDDYAELTEGHVIIGPCRKAGAFSTTCRARIDGPNPMRYRILITGTVARNYYVTIRAR